MLSSVMDMACLTKRSHYKQLESILAVLEVECNEEMKRVGQKIAKKVLEENQEINIGQPMNIPVRFKSTSTKRAFTLLNGVVSRS